MESAGAAAIGQVRTEDLEAWEDAVFAYGRYH